MLHDSHTVFAAGRVMGADKVWTKEVGNKSNGREEGEVGEAGEVLCGKVRRDGAKSPGMRREGAESSVSTPCPRWRPPMPRNLTVKPVSIVEKVPLGTVFQK